MPAAEFPLPTPPWYVYIVRCFDRSYYTGITTDLMRRLSEHNSGRGAKYTRPRLPVVLVYSEPALSRSAAARREYQIKQLSQSGKKNLMKSTTFVALGAGTSPSDMETLAEAPSGK